jgi:hypothetical protein
LAFLSICKHFLWNYHQKYATIPIFCHNSLFKATYHFFVGSFVHVGHTSAWQPQSSFYSLLIIKYLVYSGFSFELGLEFMVPFFVAASHFEAWNPLLDSNKVLALFVIIELLCLFYN